MHNLIKFIYRLLMRRISYIYLKFSGSRYQLWGVIRTYWMYHGQPLKTDCMLKTTKCNTLNADDLDTHQTLL